MLCHSQSPVRLGDTHSYNIRHANNIALPTHRLTGTEEKPNYMESKLYNLLPNHLKEITEKRWFKNEILNWLLEKSFYTLDTFINWRLLN